MRGMSSTRHAENPGSSSNRDSLSVMDQSKSRLTKLNRDFDLNYTSPAFNVQPKRRATKINPQTPPMASAGIFASHGGPHGMESPFETYEQALQFLFGRINYERLHCEAYTAQDLKLDR